MRHCLFVLLLATCRAVDPPPTAHAAGPLAWTVGEGRGARVDANEGSSAPLKLAVRTILGGAGSIEELEVGRGEDTYRGLHVVLHERERDRWMSHYANNVRGRLVALKGGLESDGFTWRNVAPERTRESRLVDEQIGENQWRRTQQVSEDGGLTWRVLFIDELERVQD